MSYSEVWVETDPDGSIITVSQLDDYIRQAKRAIRERVESFFVDFDADPWVVKSGVSFAGSVNIVGDFAVNTNKFNVAASSGNTIVAGTFGVTGVASFTAGISVNGGTISAAGSIYTTASLGMVIFGAAGSSTDLLLTNKSGQTVMSVDTGTQVATFAVGITITSGTSGMQAITATAITATTSITTPATGAYLWNGRSQIKSPSDGILTFLNNAGTDFTRFGLGGTTASFPALKRNGTAVLFRLADDSTYCDVVTGGLQVTNGLQVDTGGITVTADGINMTGGRITTLASASGGAGFRLPHGAAPTSPTNGDVWTTTAGLFARINGATVGPYT